MPDNRKDIQEFKSYGNPESPEELKSMSTWHVCSHVYMNDKVDLLTKFKTVTVKNICIIYDKCLMFTTKKHFQNWKTNIAILTEI